MAVVETWVDTDVEALPQVKVLSGRLFSGDSLGNRFGVRLWDGDSPVNISGSIVGKVLKPDGETLTVNGSSSENRAWIELPSGCYSERGRLAVVVKVQENSIVTTLGAVEAYVM